MRKQPSARAGDPATYMVRMDGREVRCEKPPMDAEHLIPIEILVVRELELGWLCEIAGRPTFVGRLQLPPGSHMPPERQRGSVRMPVAMAMELGLLARRSA